MMLHGVFEVGSEWRARLRVGGGVVTDAKSLYDHMCTTGQIPSERQTMLDLLVAKDLLEQEVFKLYWVPTHRQACRWPHQSHAQSVWEEYLTRKTISLKETAEEKATEEHRKQLRKGQRERRKERSKQMVAPSTVAAPKLCGRATMKHGSASF